MEIILKFNLPDEEHQCRLAIQSDDMYYVISKMDNWLRGKIKYAPDSMSEDTYNAYEDCRNELKRLINNQNLKIE